LFYLAGSFIQVQDAIGEEIQKIGIMTDDYDSFIIRQQEGDKVSDPCRI